MNKRAVDMSFVMPCYKCESTIKKAIDSLIDQDVKTWELICVVNGDWDKKKDTIKIIEEYASKDSRIRLLVIDEANACTARNEGAKISNGAYLSFFSSDFYMFPGGLRKWLKTFEQHPTADFIYSGYRLMDNGKFIDGFVPSEPFDSWRLQIENYIDGGFPMKRIVWECGKWDSEIKSLNDWDFWLTAIDNNFVGYYMPDMTYAAEVPKAGGLSNDSSNNWLERVSYIKKKHNIPERDICVVSLGAQPHGKRIAKILGADFKTAPMYKPNKYKAIYLLGFYVGDGQSAIHHQQVFKSPDGKIFEGKKLVHWIGSDILQLVGASYKVCYHDYKIFMDALSQHTNLSEFDVTQNELVGIGLQSKVVPLPIEKNIEVLPLPKKFKLAIYTPETATSAQIYNLELMKDIVKACPDIDFLFFGGGLKDFKADNVENVGWCEMSKILEKSSCLLRITYHDGLPVTPIEFRLAGRDAITSVNMPYIHFAGSGIVHAENYSERKEAIIKLIRDVKKSQKKGVKDLDKARKYYLNLTSPKKFKDTILEIINEA